ncbi:saccharopine dehydrogenase-like oxidoreductase [Diabrotica undecimpunctata]|uniref:saccharopine dehydrogenase-like oxidoreductase n=1 Tax=Diabrotica undecimpunctata TaxID=50387 RepID=UPI003B636947
MMSDQRLDLLLFGASGFTGNKCIPYLYTISKENGRNLTWGVSGRSEEKLRKGLETTGQKIGADLSNIPIIVADVKDQESIKHMVKKTRVLINCCGPYKYLGKPVVEACIAAGTHHVDVTAEPEFVDMLSTDCHEAAKEKGVYVVTTCGMDCIPTDLGLAYLEEKFDGVLNSLVAYLEAWQDDKSSGPGAGYGTWASLVHGMKHGTQFRRLKERMFPGRKPAPFQPELKVNYFPHHAKVVDGWSLVYPAVDKQVMRKSQTYLYEHENKRPVQVETLINIKSTLHLIGISIGFSVWLMFAQFWCGRYLLLNYPRAFTYGLFSKDKLPEDKIVENCWYQITWYGEGWKEKLPDKDAQYSTPPNKSIVAQLKAKNPGYALTCAGIVGSAVMILTEREKLPPSGGVYTPGAAFRKTSLMKLLMDYKTLTIEILSINDL